MGVIRFPRPTGIYVPSSPTRSVTPDMISSPLSADFTFDAETLTPSIIPALEYISAKLQQKMVHITLLVGRGKPYPTGQPSDLIVIPTVPLDQSTWRILSRTVAKGSNRYSLGQSWMDALNRSQHERNANEYLIQQSILQNEVVFSREGLTLLNVDRIYTFKRRLCILSTTQTPPKESYITSCVQLLHRTIQDFQGRPFSKAFFHRVYEQLNIGDDLLIQVADAYKRQYGQEGIVLAPQPKPLPKPVPRAAPKPAPKTTLPKAIPKPEWTVAERKSPVQMGTARTVRIVRAKKHAASPRSGTVPAKRGPKTPLSASDVTPITRNEWNILVGAELRRPGPVVAKWTPSPTVMAAA